MTYTPLTYAIGNGHYDACVLLIESGVNLRKVDYMRIAVNNNWTSICELLIDSGVEVDIETYIAAIQLGNTDICRMLLDTGIDDNEDEWGLMTPLYMALEHNNIELCELLIQRGASIRRCRKCVRPSSNRFCMFADSLIDVMYDLLMKNRIIKS